MANFKAGVKSLWPARKSAAAVAPCEKPAHGIRKLVSAILNPSQPDAYPSRVQAMITCIFVAAPVVFEICLASIIRYSMLSEKNRHMRVECFVDYLYFL